MRFWWSILFGMCNWYLWKNVWFVMVWISRKVVCGWMFWVGFLKSWFQVGFQLCWVLLLWVNWFGGWFLVTKNWGCCLSGMWCYCEFLFVWKIENIVSLGEVCMLLIDCWKFGYSLNVCYIMIKDEGWFFIGFFKVCGFCMVVSMVDLFGCINLLVSVCL